MVVIVLLETDIRQYQYRRLLLGMQESNCPVCHKKPVEPINLRCDHHPCYQCATSIMTQHQQSPNDIETKYRIVCPLCSTKTLTYDIRHLIISLTEQDCCQDQDDMLYVTTKYLSKKPEVQPTRKQYKAFPNYIPSNSSNRAGGNQPKQVQVDNYVSCGRTHSKKNSTHNLGVGAGGFLNVCSSSRGAPPVKSRAPINFQCKNHAGFSLQFYCQECYSSKCANTDIFLCSQCVKAHAGKFGHSHKLTSIREASYDIHMINRAKKQQDLPCKKKQLQSIQKSLLERQESLNGEFQKLYKDLNEEFKQLYTSINDQYESLKKQIKSLYSKQNEELKTNIQFVQRLKDSLSGLQKMYMKEGADSEAEVGFYIFSTQIENAIEANKAKLGRISQTPKLKRKVSAMVMSDKLVELGYGDVHRKTMSRLVSPSSARSSHYNSGKIQDFAGMQAVEYSGKGKSSVNFELYASVKAT